MFDVITQSDDRMHLAALVHVPHMGSFSIQGSCQLGLELFEGAGFGAHGARCFQPFAPGLLAAQSSAQPQGLRCEARAALKCSLPAWLEIRSGSV